MKKKIGKRELILVIVAVVMLIVGGGYELFYVPKAVVSGNFTVTNDEKQSSLYYVPNDDPNYEYYDYNYSVYPNEDDNVCKIGYSYYTETGKTKNVNFSIEAADIIKRTIKIPKKLDGEDVKNAKINLLTCGAYLPDGTYVTGAGSAIEIFEFEISENNSKTLPIINMIKNQELSNEQKAVFDVEINSVNGLDHFELEQRSSSKELYMGYLNYKISPVYLYGEKSYSRRIEIERKSEPYMYFINVTDTNGNFSSVPFLVESTEMEGPFCYAVDYNLYSLQFDRTLSSTVTCYSEDKNELKGAITLKEVEGTTDNFISFNWLNNSNIDEDYSIIRQYVAIRKNNNAGKWIQKVDKIGTLNYNSDRGDYIQTLFDTEFNSVPSITIELKSSKTAYKYGDNIKVGLLITDANNLVGQLSEAEIKNIIKSSIVGFNNEEYLNDDAVEISNYGGCVGCNNPNVFEYYLTIKPKHIGKLKLKTTANSTGLSTNILTSIIEGSLELDVEEPEKPICVMYRNDVGNPSSKKLGEELMFAFECSSGFVFSNTNQNSTSSIKKEDINVYLNGKLDNDAVEFLTMKDTNSYFEFAGVNSTSNAVAFAFLIKHKKIGSIEISLKEGVTSDIMGEKFNEESNKVKYNVYDEKVVKPVCNVSFESTKITVDNPLNINISCKTKDSKFIPMTNEEISNSLFFGNTGILGNVEVLSASLNSDKNVYTIKLRAFGHRTGSTSVFLNADAFKETYGIGNEKKLITNVITVAPKPVDKTAPICKFIFNDTKVKSGNTITGYLSCTDASGLKDSDISSSDIESSGLIKKFSVESIRKLNSTAGLSYTWAITLKGKFIGSGTVSLKYGAIVDNAGNKNAKTTSSSIKVSLFK